MQNKYVLKEKVIDILMSHNVTSMLIYAIKNIPSVDAIPVEWIKNWMEKKYGFEHSTCVRLLNDWENDGRDGL